MGAGRSAPGPSVVPRREIIPNTEEYRWMLTLSHFPKIGVERYYSPCANSWHVWARWAAVTDTMDHPTTPTCPGNSRWRLRALSSLEGWVMEQHGCSHLLSLQTKSHQTKHRGEKNPHLDTQVVQVEDTCTTWLIVIHYSSSSPQGVGWCRCKSPDNDWKSSGPHGAVVSWFQGLLGGWGAYPFLALSLAVTYSVEPRGTNKHTILPY